MSPRTAVERCRNDRKMMLALPLREGPFETDLHFDSANSNAISALPRFPELVHMSETPTSQANPRILIVGNAGQLGRDSKQSSPVSAPSSRSTANPSISPIPGRRANSSAAQRPTLFSTLPPTPPSTVPRANATSPTPSMKDAPRCCCSRRKPADATPLRPLLHRLHLRRRQIRAQDRTINDRDRCTRIPLNVSAQASSPASRP